MACEEHEKDVVRLMTVRAIVYEAMELVGGREALENDKVGKLLIDVMDRLEGRTVEITKDVLGLARV